MKNKKSKRSILLNLKVTSKDRKELQAMSKKYMNGNLSAWLRFAGTAFKPSRNQLSRG